MINKILDGFTKELEELEKLAFTRYAIEDHSDEASSESPFLHRKAESSTSSEGPEYVPPSKQKNYKKKKAKYFDRGGNSDSETNIDVDSILDDSSLYDYQTHRSMLPDPPITEFK